MPYYNYICHSCDIHFLKRFTMEEYAATEEGTIECPTCGETNPNWVKRDIKTPLTIIYRGGGWGGE